MRRVWFEHSTITAVAISSVAVIGLWCVRASSVSWAADGSTPKLSEIAPAADLATEAEQLIQEMEAALADQEQYKKASKAITHQATVLAILAQAVAQTDETSPWKSPAAVRDAALKLSGAENYPDAKTAYDQIRGLVNGEEVVDGVQMTLEEIADLHPVMEEVSKRTTSLRRAMRSSAFRKEETRDAAARNSSTMAVLLLIARSDTHHVENESDLPQWQEMADTVRNGLVDLRKAFRENDYTAARKQYIATMKACNECHKKFRPEIEM